MKKNHNNEDWMLLAIQQWICNLWQFKEKISKAFIRQEYDKISGVLFQRLCTLQESREITSRKYTTFRKRKINTDLISIKIVYDLVR